MVVALSCRTTLDGSVEENGHHSVGVVGDVVGDVVGAVVGAVVGSAAVVVGTADIGPADELLVHDVGAVVEVCTAEMEMNKSFEGIAATGTAVAVCSSRMFVVGHPVDVG